MSDIWAWLARTEITRLDNALKEEREKREALEERVRELEVTLRDHLLEDVDMT